MTACRRGCASPRPPARGARPTWRTPSSKGQITASKVQHTKGFTAACTRPATYRWTKVRNQQLVMITEGGYDGMYVAPDGYRVRYPGEF